MPRLTMEDVDKRLDEIRTRVVARPVDRATLKQQLLDMARRRTPKLPPRV